jgi:Putative phage tail protein
VVDLVYDPDVFPQGRPNVTAVMRGAKCLDPRDNSTAWTENPALHAYHYARWSSGWALTDASIRVSDVEAAADLCDVSTSFTLTATGGGTTTETLPRYRCGITISADADHAEAMGGIMATMAGAHAWAGGIWRMRAGGLGSTVDTITSDWLVQDTRNGKASDDPVITAVQTITRAQRFNRITGSCVDPAQRYQLLPFPAIQDDVLVAAKGRRALEVQFQGVTHIAHAQHLASIIIRQAQAGLKLELSLGQQAADLEVFDVVAVTLDKYGYSAKTFEVIGWEWGQQGAYKVQLAEITAAMFTVESPLTGRDPAPDSDLRAPWDVEQVTGLAVTSGTTAQTDGSIIVRTVVSWNPAGGQNIRQGGQIEVQYTEATGTLPTGEWPSWVEPGTATQAIIPSLLSGRHYLFRARAVQPPPTMVRGPWSGPVVRYQIASKPLVQTGGLASNVVTDVYDGSVVAGPVSYSNVA